jgi:transposase
LKQGNIVEYLNNIINFEVFREELEANMLNQEEKNGYDCKSYDVVMMFKIIVIKRFYNLSDEKTEYEIIDRLSFKKFLGVSSLDQIPDAQAIRLFHDNLIMNNLEEKLFERVHKYLESLGLFVKEGHMVNFSIAEVPQQQNKEEENENSNSEDDGN